MGTSRDRRSLTPTDDDEDTRGSRGRDRKSDDDKVEEDERWHRSKDEGSPTKKEEKGDGDRKRDRDDGDRKRDRGDGDRKRDRDDGDRKRDRGDGDRKRDRDDGDRKRDRDDGDRKRDRDDGDRKRDRDNVDDRSERRHSCRRRGDDDRRDDRRRGEDRRRNRRGGGHHRGARGHHHHDDDRDRSRRRSPSRRRRSRERRPTNRRSRWSRSPERRKPFKFDSPPKELAATLMGNGGSGGLLPQTVVSSSSTIKEAFNATLAAERQKIARELYIGQIPPGISAGVLIDVLNDGLMNMGANAMPGRPIVHGWLGGDGLFAFVEFRTAEEASIALDRLNGHQLKSYGVTIKVGRPKGYMGPAPEDSANAYNAGNNKGPSAAEVSSDTNRLCLIGFPLDSSEHSIKKALRTAAKGDIRHLELLKHIWNNKLIVLAVFECEDPESELRLKRKGEVEIHGKRAKIINPRDAIVKGYMNLDGEIIKKGMGLAIVPSRILVMTNFAGSVEELLDDVNYNDLLEDIKLECKSITGGVDVRSILIPRPETSTAGGGGGGGVNTPNGVNGSSSTIHHDSATMDDNMDDHNNTPSSAAAAAVPAVDMQVPGLGCCFMEFRNVEEAAQVKRIIDGRIFGGHEVFVTYFSETRFKRGDFANPMPNTDEPEVGLKDIGPNPPPIDDGMDDEEDDDDDMDVEGSDNGMDILDTNDTKVRKKAPPQAPAVPLAAEDLEIID
ncbi:hypothetical protein FOL47_005958 [Perkinsus chesapeaki]|uniref:RRM domain-containing protein n=1 Tax=Perkinsus chesapeaki TaxID=330153 RepID=A0A7J6MY13_PERCH|nr:hypothetical protein FOL47_005958 [Perkinsus chesapeaki]